MGCCGGKRAAFRRSGVDGPRAEPQERAPAGTMRGLPPPPVLFEYVGETGLTARGPVTGARYRFAEPGARVAVDGQDAPSMAAVPNLRRASESSAS